MTAARDGLAAVPAMFASPPASSVSKLPKPTKRDNAKGKCSECGGWHGLPAVHLDYMGHADVTLALIAVDPEWTWAPAGVSPSGEPAISQKADRLVMWAWLTVLGVSRLCVGTCEAGKPDPEKELIGDMLRNGAMRFGIGTSLWSKAGVAAGADPAGLSSRNGVEDDHLPYIDPAPAPADAPEPRQPTPDEMEGKALFALLPDLPAAVKGRLKAWVAQANADRMDAAVELGEAPLEMKLIEKHLVTYPEWRQQVAEQVDALIAELNDDDPESGDPATDPLPGGEQ